MKNVASFSVVGLLLAVVLLMPACKGKDSAAGGKADPNAGVVVNDKEAQSPIPAAPSAAPLSPSELYKSPKYTLETALQQPADKVYRLEMKGDFSAKMPDELFKFNNLQELTFQSCKIVNLPVGVVNFQNLQKLTVYDNPEIAALPNDWSKLKHIDEIGFHHGGKMKGLPESFGKLSTLTTLVFTGDQSFEVFPAPIFNLTGLRDMRFGAPITQIPDDIGKLVNLSSLTFAKMKAEKLPATMGKLTKLSSFWVYNCAFTELPAEMGDAGKLSQLVLVGTKITKLPESFSKLPLNGITISETPEFDLPAACKILASTKNSGLAISKVQKPIKITADIAAIPTLKSLSFSSVSFENAETDLALIGSVAQLTSLKVYDCGLKSIPAAWGKLVALTSLDLGYNPDITTLPKELSALVALTSLYVDAKMPDAAKAQAAKMFPKAKISWPGKPQDK